MAVTKIQGNTNGYPIYFTFTHTEGEAEESFTVYGKIIVKMAWINENNAQPVVLPVITSFDTTTGISTITTYCNQKVTSGEGFVVTLSK